MKLKEKIKKILVDIYSDHYLEDDDIEPLIDLFKSYACSLVPEEQISRWDDVDFGPEGPDDAAVDAMREDEIFCTGWNRCRKEMLKKIEKIESEN